MLLLLLAKVMIIIIIITFYCCCCCYYYYAIQHSCCWNNRGMRPLPMASDDFQSISHPNPPIHSLSSTLHKILAVPSMYAFCSSSRSCTIPRMSSCLISRVVNNIWSWRRYSESRRHWGRRSPCRRVVFSLLRPPAGYRGRAPLGIQGARPPEAKWIWLFDITKNCLPSEKF